jgi:hypothetical protein
MKKRTAPLMGCQFRRAKQATIGATRSGSYDVGLQIQIKKMTDAVGKKATLVPFGNVVISVCLVSRSQGELLKHKSD